MKTSSRADATRLAVRRAAAQVFLEKGFSDASIQDIADRLGMHKGSVYYHIASKEELLHEILLTGITGLNERLEAIAHYPLSALDRLRLAIRDSMRTSIEEVHGPVAIALERDILRVLTPEHRAEYIGLRDEYQRVFVGLLQAAIDGGECRPFDARMAAFALLGMLAYFQSWYKSDGPLTINDVADRWWEFLRAGLGG